MKEIKINKIIRTKRKTLALVVNQDAELIIRAPFDASDEYIQKIVQKKRLWIKEKQEKVRRRPSPKIREFVSGESFLFLGKNYKLQIVDEEGINIELRNNLTIPKNILPFAREALIEWYKERAKEKIPKRVSWYANLTGLQPASVRITNAMKRWGSCGRKGSLNFSWRLVMAPIRIIDYVIVHELMHLEEKNHSPDFWRKIRVIMPDYKRRMEWLRENEGVLRV